MNAEFRTQNEEFRRGHDVRRGGSWMFFNSQFSILHSEFIQC